jgi:V/A-type H+-transporting ATPase subunit D
MAELQRELVFTRVAFLELQDERRLVKEGYELLVEKRILLASQIRRQLQRLRQLSDESRKLEEAAIEALRAALRLHGLDELSVYPPLSLADDHLEIRTGPRLFGLQLIEAHLEESPSKDEERAVNPTPEARDLAFTYREWLKVLIERLSYEINLRRLVREYVRTERRARAIENVLLPEIEAGLKIVGEQLESADLEELARLRSHTNRQPSTNLSS